MNIWDKKFTDTWQVLGPIRDPQNNVLQLRRPVPKAVPRCKDSCPPSQESPSMFGLAASVAMSSIHARVGE